MNPHSPKRILFVITKSNWGGAQMYVYDLAYASRKAGHSVAVAVGGTGELVTRLKSIGVTVYPTDGLARDFGLSREVRALLSLRKTILDFKPDVIHLNSSKVGVLGGVIARLTRVPKIIFTAHGWPFFEDRSPLWKFVAWTGSQLTVCLAHQVICVSQNDLTQTNFRYGTQKLKKIYNGVTLPILLPRSITESTFFNPTLIALHRDSLRLVTIGELHPNKNHLLLLQALVTLKKTHPEKTFLLTIIGSGELERDLRDFVSTHHLTNDVVFAGFVNEPFEYLQGFDVLVFPSKKEGLPYTLLFSAQLGIPIIASRVGGIPEILGDVPSSILINPNSREEMTDALLLMHTRHLGRHEDHSTLLLPAFQKETMVEKTLAYYE